MNSRGQSAGRECRRAQGAKTLTVWSGGGWAIAITDCFLISLEWKELRGGGDSKRGVCPFPRPNAAGFGEKEGT